MDRKFIKILPIILMVIVIANEICSSIKGISLEVPIYVALAKTILMTYITSFLVFYVGLKKKQSPMALIGLIAVGVCLLLVVIYFIKSDSIMKLTDYNEMKKARDSLATLRNIQSTATQIVSALRIMVIIQLISVNTTDSITQLSKVGAVLAIVVDRFINIIGIWKELSIDSFIYKVGSVASDTVTILVFTFIVFQLFAEEDKELLAKEKIESPLPDNPQASGLDYKDAAFRETNQQGNQVLTGQQQATMIAQQQVVQSLVTTPPQQMVQSPISTQQPVNLIQNTMPQQTPIEQQVVPTINPNGPVQ